MPHKIIPVQVQHWSVDNLITYGEHVIHELAVKSVGTTTSYRLVLGRCLMAVDQTRLYQQFGCSGAVHYARNVLGLNMKEARTLRRVARELERLPRMRLAAEHGKIAWSKLREIVGKATPETEDAWLALADRMSGDELAKVASCTGFGESPAQKPDDDAARGLVHFRLQLREETHELFQHAARAVSKSLDKAVSVTEALEYLVVEHLEKRPTTAERVDRARNEAAQSRANRRARRAKLLEEARETVSWQTRREEPHDALQQALGSEPLFPVEDSSLEPASPDEEFQPSTEGSRGPGRDTSADEARLAQWRAMFAATDESCPGRSDLSLVDADHWKARRLRFNPKARRVSAAQRREILRRDGHRCRTPGCTHHVWLDVHHHIPFSQNGPTLPWNLLTLCTRCHANVHAGFLIIEGDQESGFRFLNRGLTPIETPGPLEVAHWIDFWLGWSGGPYDCHKGRDWARDEAS